MMLFILFLLATVCMHSLLLARQILFLKTSAQQQPNPKAISYSLSKLYCALIKSWIISLLVITLIYNQALATLLTYWQQLITDSILSNSALLLTIVLLWQLINIPFSWYQVFIIERRYGFNTMSLQIFILDAMKRISLVLLVSAPLAFTACWLSMHSQLWWLWLWVMSVVIGGFMIFISPLIKSQFFYHQIPIADGGLLSAMQHLVTTYHFSKSKIFLINSSARTKHANAHLIGFGPFKRILLSDTLIEGFSNEEITAIVAHEIGHYYYQHILKYALCLAAVALITSFLLCVLETTIQNGAILMLIFPMLTFWAKPVKCKITRYYETQADEFAQKEGYGQSLHHALNKLYNNNASILINDPLYSAWFDTHPPPKLRLETLEGC